MALDVVIKSEEEPYVELIGKVVDVDVKKIQSRLDHFYKKKTCERIVLDVTAVDFIDSHGLGAIVYFHTLLQKEKRRLIILNGNPDQNSFMNKLFEVTNLDKVLNITCSLDD